MLAVRLCGRFIISNAEHDRARGWSAGAVRSAEAQHEGDGCSRHPRKIDVTRAVSAQRLHRVADGSASLAAHVPASDVQIISGEQPGIRLASSWGATPDHVDRSPPRKLRGSRTMGHKTYSLVALILGLSFSCPLFVSCGDDDVRPVSSAGTLRMAIKATAPSGTSYRLRHGAFDIVGPSQTTLSTETNLDDETLEVALDAGNYQVTLNDGWFLERTNGDGTYDVVDAVLLSDKTQDFTIISHQTTNIRYRFRVAGEVVEIGGTLAIGIDVVEAAGGTGAGGESGFDATLCERVQCEVWATGDNRYGQLGDGTFQSRTEPVRVNLPAGVRAVSAGYFHSLALMNDGSVWSWGQNTSGQVGDGTTTNRATPAKIAGLQNVIAIDGGEYHSLAVESDGSVWTWGNRYDGDLMTEDPTGPLPPPRLVPARIDGLPRAIAVSAGWEVSLVLTSSGTVWAWGTNDYYTITSMRKSVPQPTLLPGLENIVAIRAGYQFSFVLDGNGKVWRWLGGNQIPIDNVKSLAFGYETPAVALDGDGQVWTWGWNGWSALGYGVEGDDVPTPAPLAGLSGIVGVAAGHGHGVAFGQHAAWAWGRNEYGQQGNGTTVPAGSGHGSGVAPTFTNITLPIVSVSAEGSHTLLLLKSE
jgi:alpha-tubulin suppressor-like RCC1 family protein